MQAHAQRHIALPSEKTEQGVTLFPENHWMCPYTVDFDVILTNVKVSRSLPVRVVLPTYSRIELWQFTPAPGVHRNYEVDFFYKLGDALRARHDAQYVYQ